MSDAIGNPPTHAGDRGGRRGLRPARLGAARALSNPGVHSRAEALVRGILLSPDDLAAHRAHGRQDQTPRASSYAEACESMARKLLGMPYFDNSFANTAFANCHNMALEIIRPQYDRLNTQLSGLRSQTLWSQNHD